MMNIRHLLILMVIMLLLTISPSLYAQSPTTKFDPNKGFHWLINHCEQGNCGTIATTALTTLALRDSGALDHAQLTFDSLLSQEDTNEHCWPAGNCKIKDTAFALLVLNEYGEDTDPAETYLQNAISVNPQLKNFWYLEVITSNNGTCTLTYDKSGNSQQKQIPVAQGTFPTCPQSPVSTFLDLNACIEPDLLTKNPSIELDVNCNNLGPSTILTLLFTKDSEFYIIEKASTAHEVFTIQNGCFGQTKKASCDLETSLYANWILFNTGAGTPTALYLKNSYDKFKTLHNALLYLSTNDAMKKQYLDSLLELQRSDGSFNKNIKETAIAVLALKASGEGTALANAISWLESKQDAEGSWENNAETTALVLYAAFAGAAITLPPPITPGGESIFECGDGFCDRTTESESTCPEDCETISATCNKNGRCEKYFEDSATCPEDCTCGDGTCDDEEFANPAYECPQDCEASSTALCGNTIVEGQEECDVDESGLGDDLLCPGNCQADCTCPREEEESEFPWWIPVVIVIILLGLLVFYWRSHATAKPSSRKPSTFPFTPQQPIIKIPPSTPRSSSGSEKKSKAEEELEKSLEEAKKLLKKI